MNTLTQALAIGFILIAHAAAQTPDVQPSPRPTAPPQEPQSGCPTVTETRTLCSTCMVLMCIELSTLEQSCGCPTPVPTVYLDFPCGEGEDEGCPGAGCATSYDIVPPEDTRGCDDGELSTAGTGAPSAPQGESYTPITTAVTSASQSPTRGGSYLTTTTPKTRSELESVSSDQTAATSDESLIQTQTEELTTSAVIVPTGGNATAPQPEESATESETEGVVSNAAGRMAVPFLGWF